MKQKHRILHVVYSLRLGGAENVVATLATQVDRARFEPEVAALTEDGTIGDRLAAAGIPVHVVGKRPGIDPRASSRLRRLIDDRDYALVHTHNGPPNLWTVLACPFRRRPPIVQTLHSPAEEGCRRSRRALHSLCNLRNVAIVGVSRMVTESYRRIDPINRDRYRTIYNGIDPLAPGNAGEQSRLRAELKLPEGAVVVGTVGNLRPPKAHADLLDALALVVRNRPEVVALVAGEGQSLEALMRRTAELGLERHVRWLGKRSDIGAVLATLDLFVLSSRSEGLPLALLEAIAAKVPVVSTDVGGISEAIEDGVGGTLVPPADPAALAAAIGARLDDREISRAMANEAHRLFEDRFTAAAMVRNVEQLYDEVLSA